MCMKIAERAATWHRERRMLLRVSRAAWRLEQAGRERSWALASARAEGVSIRALAAAAGLSSSRVTARRRQIAAKISGHLLHTGPCGAAPVGRVGVTVVSPTPLSEPWRSMLFRSVGRSPAAAGSAGRRIAASGAVFSSRSLAAGIPGMG